MFKSGLRHSVQMPDRKQAVLAISLIVSWAAFTESVQGACIGACQLWSYSQVGQAAHNAGFRSGALVNAIAVAEAESNGYVNAAGDLNNPGSSCASCGASCYCSIGLWQINRCCHTSYGQDFLLNGNNNAIAAYAISASGTNWWPWGTFYYNGAWQNYLTTARSTAASLDTSVIAGPQNRVRATSVLNVRSSAGGTFVGTVSSGTLGTVIGGWTVAPFSFGSIPNYPYIWWQIQWDGGTLSGWSVEDGMARDSSPPCSAVLNSPSLGASITFPQSFTWTVSGSCSSQCLAFATSSNPSYAHFTTQSSGVTISQSFWNIVVNTIGSADTYYWTVGECSGNTFTARAAWRSFTVCTVSSWYRDTDGDGHGNPSISTQACNQPSGYVADRTDCNDNNASIHPGAAEVCNNSVDEDCNGSDLLCPTTWYRDADGDGYGNPNDSTQSATQPPGYVSNNTDCNDNCSSCHPGGTETCDSKDNDCDGQSDEGVGTTWYRDADGDGYGNPSNSTQACSQPGGYVSNNSDCNDSNGNVHPGATEVCGNGIDDDCVAGDQPCNTWYRDADGDGHGNPNDSIQSTTQPPGYVSNNTDCNDSNTAVHLGAIEICGNGIDEDCNGLDLSCPMTWYRDADGDGYGNANVSVQSQTQPAGFVADHTDCNDNNAHIHPGASEICGNGIDEDCSGGDLACPPIGACCLNGKTCDTGVTQANCQNQGGNWQGPGSESCNDCIALSPSGACCIIGNTCNTGVTQADCNNAGGIWQGENTTACRNCSTPPPSGACCLPGGTCVDSLSLMTCSGLGGTLSIGQTCNNVSCAPKIGACCINGTCSTTTQADCNNQGGIWHGTNTNCNSGVCEPTCNMPMCGTCIVPGALLSIAGIVGMKGNGRRRRVRLATE